MGTAVEGDEPVRAVLRDVFGERPVDDLRRLTGGASRETWRCTVAGEPVVVQRQRAGAERDMGNEAAVLRAAVRQGVPVPEVLGFVRPADGGAALVTRHVPGETIARKILRDDEFETARSRLVDDLGRALARVHRIDPGAVPDLVAVDPLAEHRTRLDEIGEPHPALELAFRWLDDHRPRRVVTPRVVHGDFRLGNVIVDADGLAAVIDWELAHLGDPLEDLGWLCVPAWRFGSAMPAAGVGTREALCAAYTAEAGIAVDPDAVRWWEVAGILRWGIICVMQAHAHRSGLVRSHELAAIGRRVCEKRARSVPGARGAMVSSATPPLGAPHDAPSAGELLDAVRAWLERDVVPTGTAHPFHARVAANVLAIVEREIALGADQALRHRERLERLGVADDTELAAAIRAGRLDDRLDEVRALVWESVRDKLAVANPGYLDRVES